MPPWLVAIMEKWRPDRFLTPEQAAAIDARRKAEADEEARRDRLRALKATGVPLPDGDLRAVVWGDHDWTPCMRDVEAWLGSGDQVRVLFGPVGIGKTYAAAWALSKVAGRYTRAHRLAAIHRLAFGDERAEWETLCTASLLVVDELGVEDNARSAAAAITEVVDERQKDGRRTLLMGNLALPDIRKRYGDRLADRVNGLGSVTEQPGESRRWRP
jgi:DNA replication protein DnaC